MSSSADLPRSPLRSLTDRVLSKSATHIILGAAILLLDLFTGKFLLFPILFVLPVGLSAWYCNAPLSYTLAALLPVGRFFIASFVDDVAPIPYNLVNALVRVIVLAMLAFLVNRMSRHTKELREQLETLVTICVRSGTVEYEGNWISFEEYLQRRFHIQTSQGLSPTEAQKLQSTLKTLNRGASIYVQRQANFKR